MQRRLLLPVGGLDQCWLFWYWQISVLCAQEQSGSARRGEETNAFSILGMSKRFAL